MNNNLAPIALFVYKRIEHLKQTIESLKKNHLAKHSKLIIFSDGPKNHSEFSTILSLRDYLLTIKGFESINIIERPYNFGLAKNVIEGVSEIINEYGRIIVLEDDLVTSPFFLTYMNDALNLYEEDYRVGCIHGYIYPINNINDFFFIRGADCWGWATWKRAWECLEKDGSKLLAKIKYNSIHKEEINIVCGFNKMLKDQIYGKNDSWAVRWYFSCVLNNMYCLYPPKSFIQNIGNDSSGTHSKDNDVYRVQLASEYDFKKIPVYENKERLSEIIRFHYSKSNFIKKVYLYFLRMIT